MLTLSSHAHRTRATSEPPGGEAGQLLGAPHERHEPGALAGFEPRCDVTEDRAFLPHGGEGWKRVGFELGTEQVIQKHEASV